MNAYNFRLALPDLYCFLAGAILVMKQTYIAQLGEQYRFAR